jgi:hypothetical protein
MSQELTLKPHQEPALSTPNVRAVPGVSTKDAAANLQVTLSLMETISLDPDDHHDLFQAFDDDTYFQRMMDEGYYDIGFDPMWDLD